MSEPNFDQTPFHWTVDSMVEVSFTEPDDFLKIRETLTRIGVASKKSKTLYQSCHILHKKGLYFIVHFKELFLLDGKPSNITITDIHRRNTIVALLEEWGLLTVLDKQKITTPTLIKQIKVIPYSEKNKWDLQAKYSIGSNH